MITQRWVHAAVVQAENPVEVVVKKGWGIHFGERKVVENWFHFPIPTLSTVDNRQVNLLRVFVLYRTEGAVIRSIHLYDGPKRIKGFEDLFHKGDHSGSIDDENCWSLSPAEPITYGIGISVGVHYLQDTDIAMAEILFTAAGAEFESP
jgi:uncharacterized protein DUF6623